MSTFRKLTLRSKVTFESQDKQKKLDWAPMMFSNQTGLHMKKWQRFYMEFFNHK